MVDWYKLLVEDIVAYTTVGLVSVDHMTSKAAMEHSAGIQLVEVDI